MSRRKERAVDIINTRAAELNFAVEEIVWDSRPRDGRWALRVVWDGGHRVVAIEEDLLIDEDTGNAFDGQILRWFGDVVRSARDD